MKLIKKDQGRSWELEIPDSNVKSISPYDGGSLRVFTRNSDETIICSKVIF